MENMSFSFIAKELVIWISLILLIVSLVSASADREKGRIGECFGKCADLGIDCDELCRDSGFHGGVSAIRVDGTVGECFVDCKGLGMDCNKACTDSGFPAGACIFGKCCCLKS
ncbi:uncharacterized protein LOC141678795 [Apium graveolens]|uniref:uncharacterized protein LOC141678795 n=1 Tax=Apium graveolens TaxID=4045 RepID=UPI003D79E02A